MATLTEALSSTAHTLEHGESTTIGRYSFTEGKEEASIMIDPPFIDGQLTTQTMSSKHAAVTFTAGTLTIENFMKNAHAERSVRVDGMEVDVQIEVDGTTPHTITVCGLEFTFSPEAEADANNTQEYQGENDNDTQVLDENQTQEVDGEDDLDETATQEVTNPASATGSSRGGGAGASRRSEWTGVYRDLPRYGYGFLKPDQQADAGLSEEHFIYKKVFKPHKPVHGCRYSYTTRVAEGGKLEGVKATLIADAEEEISDADTAAGQQEKAVSTQAKRDVLKAETALAEITLAASKAREALYANPTSEQAQKAVRDAVATAVKAKKKTSDPKNKLDTGRQKSLRKKKKAERRMQSSQKKGIKQVTVHSNQKVDGAVRTAVLQTKARAGTMCRHDAKGCRGAGSYCRFRHEQSMISVSLKRTGRAGKRGRVGGWGGGRAGARRVVLLGGHGRGGGARGRGMRGGRG